MQYTTKQQRLIAIVDAHRQIVNRPWTTEEVSVWALANRLWPVPKRGDPAEACEAWEARLAAAREQRSFATEGAEGSEQ